MGISRRTFVGGAGGAAVAAALGRTDTAAASEPPRRFGQDDPIMIDALSATAVGDQAFETIAHSGLTMIETTVGPAGTPTFSYEAAVRDIATWHGNFARYPDRLIHVLRADDVARAKREGKLGVMLGFQNGTHLNRDSRNIDFFHSLGIRQIQLTYNELNALGAGCTEREDVGLSDFGIAVVKRMNELGILVDLSHCGYRTTMDGIEFSSAPVLFSHTNCKALNDNARCKTDDQIRRLAERGGVMGITTVNFFVSAKPRSTLDDFIDHIAHVADLVGIDHVGIGTDSSIQGWRAAFPDEEAFWAFHDQFDFKPAAAVRWPPFIEEIDVPEKFPIIRRRLEERGFPREDIAKVVGGNVLRVYREVLG